MPKKLESFAIRSLPLVGIAASMLLGACALQRYEPRPLDLSQNEAAYVVRTPDDDAVRVALAQHGVDVSQWPLPLWHLDQLIWLAFELHPELALARGEVAVAHAGVDSAAARSNPGLDFTLQHHTQDATSPWSIGLALDLPITGASRRHAQVAKAEALDRAAAWDAAQTAWQIRSRLRTSLLNVARTQGLRDELQRENDLRREESALFERRLELGAATAGDLALAHMREADAARSVRQADAALAQARSALATALGIAPEHLDRMNIAFDSTPSSPPDAQALQRSALHDRLDVRGALERYAAADAALQLEIAKQVPQFSLRPGYLWDQGDNVWSLGAALALPLFDRNRGPIAEAIARRTAEAARVTQLQAQAIARLHQAHLDADAARAEMRASEEEAARAAELAERSEHRFERGDADRLERVQSRIARRLAQRRVVETRSAYDLALVQLEDAVQRPLDQIPALAPSAFGLAQDGTGSSGAPQ